MRIGNREIGHGFQPFFVADVGANHDGNLSRACEFPYIVADVGADAVKYQTFAGPTIVSRRGFEELGQVGHQANWPKSVYETYEDASMPLEWLPVLAEHAEKAGVAFMSTVYSLEIVDAVDPYVLLHKLGSGDITYHELIRKVASKGKPIFLATGASTTREVEAALIASEGSPLCLLQCNTNYTGDPKNLAYSNLKVIERWSKMWSGIDIGLSDHTSGHLAVCAAVALGACVIEKHLTDDRTRPGPDHAFAMEPQEWREMIEAARLTHSALGDGIKEVKANEREAVIVQRRALRWAYDLDASMAIYPAMHTVATRPCPKGALEPYRVDELVGRVLKRDVEADTLVRLEDLS